MANEDDKVLHSKRRHKDSVKAAKQVKIAKTNGITVTSPHRYVKQRAMDCGNPRCPVCSNPRRLIGEKTIQEQRQEQNDRIDTDT